MFSKVRQKLIGAALIVVMGSSVFLTSGQTSPDALGGSLIQATPFDGRAIAAGALNFNFTPLSQAINSSDGLFFQARSIRYVADPQGQDIWQTPQETQARWSGDCEDKAVWLFAQLKRNGYFNVRLVVGRYRPSDRNFHVWVTMADDQGNVLILDPTAQKRVWKGSDFDGGYYRALYSFDGMNRYKHDE